MTPDDTPFFVLGAQRSGTTMLRLMLNSHPRLAVPHETAFITVFYPRLGEYGDLATAANMARLLDDIAHYHLVVKGQHVTDQAAVLAREPRTYPELIDAIMSQYAAARGKRRWGDKTPFYTPDIDILHSLFPQAKFIHLVRDGRDVLLSQRRIEWLSSSVPRLAEDWKWKTTICHKVGRVLGGDRFLELRYEDLVIHTEEVLRRLCDFLGERYDPAMLTYPDKAREVVPNGSLQWHQNSVEKPNEKKLYAWKHKLSKADRTIYEQIAGPTLDLFGYEREHLPSTLSSKLKALYYSTVRRW